MLEHSLADDQTAGSHLHRPATGAGWALLLPSLALRTIVCLGRPAPTAVALLERMASQVVVLGPRDSLAAQLGGLPPGSGEPSVDLVVIGRSDATRGLVGDPTAVSQLRGSLSDRAAVYEETRFGQPGLRWAPALGVGGGVAACWLTPGYGEVRTAAPGYSSVGATWLRAAGLDRATIDDRSLIVVRSALRARRRSAVPSQVRGVAAQPVASGPPSRPWAEQARRTTAGAVRSVGRIEPYLASRSARAHRHGTLAGPGIDGTLPLYVRETAAASGLDLSGHTWALVVPGDYEAQKVLFFAFAPGATDPELVIKLGRSERASQRLERAVAGLEGLRRHPALAEQAPVVAFAGRHGAFAVVAEHMVDGDPFRARTSGTSGCPLILDAVEWLTRLGSHTVQPTPATAAAEAMTEIVDRLELSYRMSASHLELLRDQCRIVAAAGQVPAVLAHGDPGVWNLMARRNGGVSVLDWENAEPCGMPLWDVLYLLRSYAVLASRRASGEGRLWSAAAPFLRDTPLRPLLRSSVARYCAEVGISTSLVAPLFHLCWAMQAVKEGARLAAVDRERGSYVTFLRLMLDQHQNPVLLDLLGSTRC